MGKRLLLVEDEEDNLTLLIHILKYLLGQEQLYIARDGAQAMILAYQQRPDLILMDLSLPKLDGWEAVRSLRADPNFRTIPIIALTAHAMSGDKERAMDAGCSDYFPKPIDIDRFIPFIEPYLAEAPKPGAAEESSGEAKTDAKPEASVEVSAAAPGTAGADAQPGAAAAPSGDASSAAPPSEAPPTELSSVPVTEKDTDK